MQTHFRISVIVIGMAASITEQVHSLASLKALSQFAPQIGQDHTVYA
jgi:hypothetical protein